MPTHLTRFSELLSKLEHGSQLLTIVFTDIVGFTARVEQEEAVQGLHAAIRLKEEHDVLIREHLPTDNCLKNLGDGCLFIFSDPFDALQRLIKLQCTFHHHYINVLPDKQLKIRVGVHTGMVPIEQTDDSSQKWDNDILGSAVNLASRVTNTAPAGTIHLTHDVYKNCGLPSPGKLLLPEGGSINDLGEIKLRNIQEKCRIWQINPFGSKIKPDLSKQQKDDATRLQELLKLLPKLGGVGYLLKLIRDRQRDHAQCGVALIIASEIGYTKIVSLLIDAGANLNVRREDDSYTALMAATEYNHIEVAQILLDAGADVNIKNNDGNTALSIAEKNENTEIALLLREAGATE